MLYPDKTCLLGSNIYEILNAITKIQIILFFFFSSLVWFIYLLFKELTLSFPMHCCSDLSYNNFTWQGPEQPACQGNMSGYLYNNCLHIFLGLIWFKTEIFHLKFFFFFFVRNSKLNLFRSSLIDDDV